MINLTTALFDIGREKLGDGRTMNQYIDWFTQTLKLNSSFTVFTEKKFIPLLEDKINSKSRIVCCDLEEIPYYHLRKNIEDIIRDPEYRSKISDPERIECNLGLYNIIQYSKFKWIEASVEMDNSFDYYFWIDAGCSRFFKAAPEILYPSLENLEIEKFNVQGNVNTGKIYPSMDIEKYKFDNNSMLVGTFFGGGKKIMGRISDEIEKILLNDMLGANMINNEQIAMAILYKRSPELFNVYTELNGDHLPFFNHVYSHNRNLALS
jgi:hypothetical protein